MLVETDHVEKEISLSSLERTFINLCEKWGKCSMLVMGSAIPMTIACGTQPPAEVRPVKATGEEKTLVSIKPLESINDTKEPSKSSFAYQPLELSKEWMHVDNTFLKFKDGQSAYIVVRLGQTDSPLKEANHLMAQRAGVSVNISQRKQNERIRVAVEYTVNGGIKVNIIITTNQYGQTVIYEAYTPFELREYGSEIIHALSVIQ